MKIVIVTHDGDAHAVLVQHALAERDVACHILAIDRVSGDRHIFIDEDRSAYCEDVDGTLINLASVDLCWWRRSPRKQLTAAELPDGEFRLMAESASFEAFTGMFLAHYEGAFVDHPEIISRAENKVLQLRTAAMCGLTVPHWIITNDIDRVHEWALGRNKFIVKNIGKPSNHMVRVKAYSIDDIYDKEIYYVPSMFQEFIDGNEHLRVVVLGEEITSFSIKTTSIDWRPDDERVYNVTSLPEKVERLVRDFMRSMKLNMGSLDLKISPEGNVVFFEVNPQGQFLFLERATGYPLLHEFVSFLTKHTAS
ncbi:ATP-grasp domain-containing protein [Sinorhizobium meliloti]|uniref:ATP-grasp domain-containing protein n=1 Tax=Rhizobium meliloti TaxID=382 RepID=UPI000FD7E715|nr:hypothetical protein [Sinorhizobium meliloti]RVO25853.1 hypothetical protein CN095_30165 [Sinorhizobium meliloti]